MIIGSIIDSNLLAEALDTEGRRITLLPDEECKYCGCELLSHYSCKVGYCGTCRPRGDKRFVSWLNGGYIRGKLCDLRNDDPDFNEGKGERFFRAFDRSIARRDFA